MHSILAQLLAQLRSQSSHSAVILLAILLVAARAAGVDVMGLTGKVTEIITALGALSAAAKILLPDSPQLPPGSAVVTPPAAAPVAAAAAIAAAGDPSHTEATR